MSFVDAGDIPWRLVRTDEDAISALAKALTAAIEIHLRRRGKSRNATLEALQALAQPAALLITSAGAEAETLADLYDRALADTLRLARPIVRHRDDAADVIELPDFARLREAALKITVESTTKIVTLVVGGHDVPARVWQGETADGIPVQCFITRIAPEIRKDHPEIDSLTAQFERELKRQADPRPTVEAIPLRMII